MAKVLDLSALKTAKRTGKDTRMNGLESAYAMELDAQQRSGEIVSWRFEGVKLRLADKTWYTPDFMVVLEHGIEFIEAKGFWRDDARVKIKVAAEMYPWFRFSAVQRLTKKQGGGWKVEQFGRATALASPRGAGE